MKSDNRSYVKAAIYKLRSAYVWYGLVVLAWALLLVTSALKGPVWLEAALFGLEVTALIGINVRNETAE